MKDFFEYQEKARKQYEQSNHDGEVEFQKFMRIFRISLFFSLFAVFVLMSRRRPMEQRYIRDEYGNIFFVDENGKVIG
jgi:hypothetical protein